MADVRLPLLLQAALAELAPDGSSAGRARALSDAYRAERPSSIAVASLGDAAAYAVSRMPATYAAVTAALAETLARIDDFAPSTMLDAGAGPGTASWSALEALPSLASVVQLDHNAELLALGQTLAGGSPVLADAERLRG